MDLEIPPAILTAEPPSAGSYGIACADWAKRKLDIDLDWWQRYALYRLLLHDDAGNLIVKQALISVARQNGKTTLVRALVGWMLDEGVKLPAFKDWAYILFAADTAPQARIPYTAVRKDLEHWSRDLSGRSRMTGNQRSAARSTLWQGLEANGIMVNVATSQAGATRGVSPGLIGFDEVLTQTDFDMLEVLQPSQLAIRNAILMLTSTAGYADSVVLRAYHDRAHRIMIGEEDADPSFLGLWWMADHDDVGPDDIEQLTKANPGLGTGRLSMPHIRNEYKVLPTGSWVRERLNRWSDQRVDAPFSIATWGACRVGEPLAPEATREDTYVIGVDVDSVWSEGAIIVAAQRRDGRIGTEVHRRLMATPSGPLTAEQFIAQIASLHTKINAKGVVYSSSIPLAPMLERYGMESGTPLASVSSVRMQQFCADFAEAVTSGRLAHNDPYLDSQIASAQRRFIGKDGAWRWAISASKIPGVMAMTLAVSKAAQNATPVQVFL